MHPKLICAAALLAGFAQAHAEHYTFTPISGREVVTFTAPALNDAGTIAQGVSASPSQRFDVWPRGGGPTTLLDTSGNFASFTALSPIPLNNNETIAFRGTLDSGVEGIYTFGPSGLRTIADTTGPFSGFGTPPSLPAFNDAGQVSFTADLRSGGSGLFRGDGSTTMTFASTTGGMFSSFSSLAVSSNNRGDTAAVGNLAGGGQALLLSSAGGPAKPIVDTSGPISSFGSLFALNDSGAISFVANLDAGGQSVFLWDSGTLMPIMSTSGAITALSNPSINERGTVSFFTSESGARLAIYTYTPGSGVQRLIGAGDPLFGSMLSLSGAPNRGVFTSVNSLNNFDELAFEAVLEDGRRLTVLASPIPEPSTLALLAVGLGAASSLIRLTKQRP